MMSDNIDKLAGALAAAQASMNAASRDRKGHHNNSYATLDSIIDTVRKPLSDNGLAFTQLLQQGETGIVLETFLLHSSGQWLQSELPVIPEAGNRGINGMQALGVSITYLKRYALAAILGVSTEEDTDGNEAHPPRTTETRQPYNASQPAPKANGNGKPKVDNPAALLEVVNEKLEPEERYQSVPHLFNSLKLVNGDTWGWPTDTPGWRTAYKQAVDRMKAADQAEMFDTGNSAYATEGEAA